jgi:hypothetical protein
MAYAVLTGIARDPLDVGGCRRVQRDAVACGHVVEGVGAWASEGLRSAGHQVPIRICPNRN